MGGNIMKLLRFFILFNYIKVTIYIIRKRGKKSNYIENNVSYKVNNDLVLVGVVLVHYRTKTSVPITIPNIWYGKIYYHYRTKLSVYQIAWLVWYINGNCHFVLRHLVFPKSNIF